jgi:3-keto-disaccharide hydrolase
MRSLLCIPIVLLALARLPAADDADYKPLFNGKDLTGWARVNCAPDTFFVKDNEIITTGKPYGYLRTDKQYENFVAEFEWMHVNKTEVGNSGFFVWGDALPVVGSPYTRGIEVQVLVNLEYKDRRTGAVTATSHGDVFAIQGAKCKPDRPHPTGGMRCLPSENRAKGGGEWNHYKIVANDGAIKLSVNGKEVSGVSECRPRKGYLALESEGAECHFRNLKIKELPSTNPNPGDCAIVDEGFRALFDGLSLNGWKANASDWKVAGDNLRNTGTSEIVTEKSYGPGRLIFDWKVPGAGGANAMAQYSVTAGGKQTAVTGKAGAWHRATVTVDSSAPIRFAGFQGVELKNVFYRDGK